ncbi:MAG: zf-HC2 domain-containing protein [Candidatus Krumholzibacteriota bacterium]|nr:zf-HC2 domain-containing protein [Candidatus Krumholzibacteriota bacterium]
MDDCRKFEEILPRYIDGDLSVSETKAVKDHIGTCESCAMALGRYIELESSLEALSGELPDLSVISSSVLDRLNIGKKKASLSAIFRLPFLMPALIALSATAVSIFRRDVESVLLRLSSEYASLVDRLTGNGIESITASLSAALARYCSAVTKFIEDTGSLVMRSGEMDQTLIISISALMSLTIVVVFFRMTKMILQD